ncbi:MAG: MarR family winged helix-turn-helix transcriptional regulator [Defluviitaleaceae bacterium]|nr:MarR family winged helix-turn-helix transcriptional regulator [Defluviitaleaceae bacterium]
MSNESKKMITTLKETWHKMDSLYDAYAKASGLNFTGLIVYELLYYSDEIHTQKGICEQLSLPKQLVNSIIKSLWEQEHVKLVEAKDRRNKEIIVTSQGRKYISSILEPLEDAEMAAWEGFADDEIANYANIMTKYVSALEDILGKFK